MTLTPHADGRALVWHGDCMHLLGALGDSSVDAIVTDPPYGLGFMGKKWDALPPGEDWARECLRVLKPGGHLLAFGGSRTWHRLAVAIEDGGFEIRDSIAWLYGSGFPKSLDVSKAIDKDAGHWRGRAGQIATDNSSMSGANYERTPKGDPVTAAAAWQGWGTALKPAFEPIVVARKPLGGTVAANVLAHGTGALNIDGCRLDARGIAQTQGEERGGDGSTFNPGARAAGKVYAADLGRWPANVVLDESQAAALDESQAAALDESQAAALDEQSGTSKSGVQTQPKGRGGIWSTTAGEAPAGPQYGDSGGASRFFYVAKAPKSERPVVDGIAHPTVKPLALMRWVARLVTPPGGLVLDTFAGSGTTGEAGLLEGFRVLLAEAEADYLPLIAERLRRVERATAEERAS